MSLAPRMEFRQTQSLVMTPQLMQAIKLLQLSNLELVAYVEAELERNPLLERAVEGEGGADPEVPPSREDLLPPPDDTPRAGDVGWNAGPGAKPRGHGGPPRYRPWQCVSR